MEIEKKNEIGINTDELDMEELRRLVENNPELKEKENECDDQLNKSDKSIDDKFKDETNKIRSEDNTFKTGLNIYNPQPMKNIILEKNKILELLKTSNNELQHKITKAGEEYDLIMSRINQKSSEDEESILSLKIKVMEKEISTFNSETENYKKLIDSVKNKLEFKINLEKAITLENILKQEIIKNKEIKKEMDSLSKVNVTQIKAISSYDKENHFTEKMDILKSEIKSIKESLKECHEKYSKQEKYIRYTHEKLSSLENMTKNITIPKLEIKKSFTKEDLKEIFEILNISKLEIIESRKVIKNMTKQHDDKLNTFINMNKKIESDFKENDKLNKMLILKKNELKRLIKNNNNYETKIENKNTKMLINNNGDISNLISKSGIKINHEELLPLIKNETEIKPKMFSKNPNGKNIGKDELVDKIENDTDEVDANEEYEDDNEVEINSNDSNEHNQNQNEDF